jgi:hypothetical protein
MQPGLVEKSRAFHRRTPPKSMSIYLEISLNPPRVPNNLFFPIIKVLRAAELTALFQSAA